MPSGTLVVLNGGSSAGKTSVGEELQNVMEEPYLLLGIDGSIEHCHLAKKDHGAVAANYYSVVRASEDGFEYFRLIPGPTLDQIMFARYRAVARLLELGLNVIADEVIWSPRWLLDQIQVFAAYHVFFFGVFVSDGEAERRHLARGRGGLGLGWYRGSARVTHTNAIYDLKIDTTGRTSRECADEIKAALNGGLQPTAFPEMRHQLL